MNINNLVHVIGCSTGGSQAGCQIEQGCSTTTG